MLDRVRTAEKLPGVSEIVIAGQKEAKMAAERVRDGFVPLERNMLAELRVLAANFAASGGVSAPAASAPAGESRTNELLERLLTRIDKLEAQVTSTAQQQQRLETVAVESIRASNHFNGRR